MSVATLSEAINAARFENKIVSYRGNYDKYEFRWHNGQLVSLTSGGAAVLREDYIDGFWEILPSPPREYTFMEAVEMMKQGKRMRPLELNGREPFEVVWGHDRFWSRTYLPVCNTNPTGSPSVHEWTVSYSEINGKWIVAAE